MRAVFCLVLLTYSAFGQGAPTLPGKAKADKELENLIQRLASLPPEFEADSLLLLVEAGKIPSDSVVATLDGAFLTAGRASVTATMRGMLPEYLALGESVPAAIAQSSGMGDQLTLRLRVVESMKTRNVEHAVELFDSIQIPRPALTCADALMPRPKRYFETLTRLYRDLQKSPKPKVREMADHWLASHLGALHESQIAPVAQELAALSAQKDLFELGLDRLSLDISKLNPSFRSWWASGNDVTLSLIALAQKAQSVGKSTEQLWRAYIGYNRGALDAARCADVKATDVAARLKEWQAQFESLSIPPDILEAFAALAAVEPRSIDAGKPDFPYFRSDPRVMEMLRSYGALRFGPIEPGGAVASGQRADGMADILPLAERMTVAWRDRAEKYLRRLEEIAKEDDKDRLGAFIKTSNCYSALIAITPIKSGQLESTVSSYIAFLAASPVLKEQPLIWLMQFRRVFRHGTVDETPEGLALARKLVHELGSQLMNTLLDIDRLNPDRSSL